jgi:hypothetical protein
MLSISLQLKEQAAKLFYQGFTKRKIASKTRLSRSHVTYCIYLAKIKQRGFNRPIDERNYWARQKGYASYSDYQLDSMKSRGTNWKKAHAKKLKKRGLKSDKEYRDDLAKRQGFKSRKQQDVFKVLERQEKPENQELGYLIQTRLAEIGETRTWLAKELGITRQEVSIYTHAKAFPRNGKLERIVELLAVDANFLAENYPNLTRLLNY